jgi:hypothetical protein
VIGTLASGAGFLYGKFSYQKSQFGYIVKGHGMENFGKLFDYWNILQPFGKF